jgi:polysaccharide export outer membrane protein
MGLYSMAERRPDDARTPIVMRTLLSVLFLAATLFAAPALAAQAADTARVDAVTLRPGDLVRVTVWREQDLSGEFLVDSDGMVTLPLVGDQLVGGVPVREMRSRLIELYRQHLRNPAITVVPLRRVNVLGEVQRPGSYPVDPTVSLAEAVAIAGGTTPNGRLDRIRIVRGGAILRERIGAAESLAVADIRSGDQIIVERRGWFDRNSASVLTAGVSLLGGILTTLIIISAN